MLCDTDFDRRLGTFVRITTAVRRRIKGPRMTMKAHGQGCRIKGENRNKRLSR